MILRTFMDFDPPEANYERIPTDTRSFVESPSLSYPDIIFLGNVLN